MEDDEQIKKKVIRKLEHKNFRCSECGKIYNVIPLCSGCEKELDFDDEVYCLDDGHYCSADCLAEAISSHGYIEEE